MKQDGEAECDDDGLKVKQDGDLDSVGDAGERGIERGLLMRLVLVHEERGHLFVGWSSFTRDAHSAVKANSFYIAGFKRYNIIF